MNYREFNPANTCLPAEAYPYLWAALSTPSQPRPTLWSRCRAAFARLCAALPVIVAAAFLPLADPPSHQLRPLSEQLLADSRIHSLVWVQPLPGKRLPAPPTLPATVENPYCF